MAKIYLERMTDITSMRGMTKNQLMAEAKERGLKVSENLRKW